METHELRIGNFVKLNRSQTELKLGIVVGMAEGSRVLNVKYEFENRWFEKEWNELSVFVDESQGDLSPMQLTKEWLLKFGFVDDSIGNNMDKIDRKFYNIHGLIFSISEEPLIYHWFDNYQDEFYSCNIGVPIRYVHQLQNLYFVLTGTELKCSL